MNNLQYEFLSYECFPDDPYLTEVVTVCFGGLLIVPYKNVKTKSGGHFWCFPGVSATRDGEKKNFNCEFDSKSFKVKFDNEVESFIRNRTALGKHVSATLSQIDQYNAPKVKLDPLAGTPYEGTKGSSGFVANLVDGVYETSEAPNDNGIPF